MGRTSLDKSFPSSPVTFADVPEVSRFNGKFIYNFFVPDESISDVGIELDSSNTEVVKKLERSSPRFVRFDFVPVRINAGGQRNNMFRSPELDPDDPSDVSIEQNYDKIKIEHELTNTSFAGVRFQDDNLDDKLYLMASGTMARSISNHNRNIKGSFRATERHINNVLSKPNISLFDAAKLLSTGHGDNVSKFIINSLNSLKQLNAQFIDDEQQSEKIERRFENVKNVGIDVQFNSKFVGTVLKSIAQDPFSLFIDEVAPILAEAEADQDNAVSTFDAGSIDAAEYETFGDPVRTRNVDVPSFNTRRKIAGYIIDKSEMIVDGRIVDLDPIIIEKPQTTRAFDTDIAYGKRYSYTIRAIAEVELVATVEDQDELIAATMLISSKPSHRIIVDCTEDISPPPPADFQVGWDRKHRAARLTWAFPVNSQRDIKKFQVFRRATINEPFQLLKEYDFDDNMVQLSSGENPDPLLVEKLKSAKTMYIDFDFNRTSKFIYAVSSVDAHGFVSNYSTQIEARFNSTKNDIARRIVSSAGAPKPYPNMFVTQDDVIVDVIKDSHHSQMAIHFDPEFLEVVDRYERKLNLLSTDRSGGSYRLQLMNTDLQQPAVLDIVLKDRRKPAPAESKSVGTVKFKMKGSDEG